MPKLTYKVEEGLCRTPCPFNVEYRVGVQAVKAVKIS